MSEQLAIAVEFNRQIEPYSDEEGLVANRVVECGLNRKTTMVSGDRRTVYVILREELEPTEDKIDEIEELLVEGFDWRPTRVDANITSEILKYEGSWGDEINGIKETRVEKVDTSELYKSAAVAEKSS